MTKRWLSPYVIYLILEFGTALLFSLVFTVHQVYHIVIVQMSPMQLVLTGTILEVAILVFEMPTGVLADIHSRRLSVIIGYAIMGGGFCLEGIFPSFGAIAAAQVIWGLGFTFSSGAKEAWIADELGQNRSSKAYLRGAQGARAGALAAIPISIALGSASVQLPIVVGGLLMVVLAALLAATMTEDGFVPTQRFSRERNMKHQLLATIQDAWQLGQRQPHLQLILVTGLFWGLYSEGFDRLWTAHLLDGFSVPWLQHIDPVIWLGATRGIMLLVSMASTEWAHRKVNTEQTQYLVRVLTWAATLIVVALIAFGLSPRLVLAVALYWCIGALRSLSDPLRLAWINHTVDQSQIRATVFSACSQFDALGQIAGGPGVGVIGNHSLRAALVASAALLLPVVPLYRLAVRQADGADSSR